jgi:hypothetical protein
MAVVPPQAFVEVGLPDVFGKKKHDIVDVG